MIADIVRAFDLVTVVELCDDLTDLGRVLAVLGPRWSVVFSDYLRDVAENRERIGFIHERGRVQFTGLASNAEADRRLTAGRYVEDVPWWRPPFMASFRRGRLAFVLLAAHVRWGARAAARRAELDALARWIVARTAERHFSEHDVRRSRSSCPITSRCGPSSRCEGRTRNARNSFHAAADVTAMGGIGCYTSEMLPDGGPQDKRAHAGVRYVRAPVPLHFPTEAEMPESKLHLALRTFLFQLLQFTFGESCSVGSEQFVYWRASDPKTCLAPDAFLKLGAKDSRFDSWKTWERGTPELAVEIVSESDRRGWDEKLAAYRDLGVRELVRFDAAAEVGQRLRVWDRVADDLVERVLDGEAAESFVLERFWVIGDVEGMAGLRLSEDVSGLQLLPSPLEAETHARQAETRAREAETLRAQAAEQRVRELEAALKNR